MLSLGPVGCDTSSDTGGTGGTEVFEPGPTCTAFCAKAVGECEVPELGGDAACKQNCELERSLAEDTTEACLEAFEESINSAAALDCQDIIDRANQVNLESYPCLPEVENTDRFCSAG
jgi:hypothetical protein